MAVVQLRRDAAPGSADDIDDDDGDGRDGSGADSGETDPLVQRTLFGNDGDDSHDGDGEGDSGDGSVTTDSSSATASAISLVRMEKFCECEIDRVLQRALRRRDAFECSKWVELVAETG